MVGGSCRWEKVGVIVRAVKFFADVITWEIEESIRGRHRNP